MAAAAPHTQPAMHDKQDARQPTCRNRKKVSTHPLTAGSIPVPARVPAVLPVLPPAVLSIWPARALPVPTGVSPVSSLVSPLTPAAPTAVPALLPVIPAPAAGPPPLWASGATAEQTSLDNFDLNSAVLDALPGVTRFMPHTGGHGSCDSLFLE